MPNLKPDLIYRLDRFGRGGHHRPFNDLGYAGVRIMEAHENYNRQHQDVRKENGIKYGDVISGVNFQYAKSLTAVNAINLASLGSPGMNQIRWVKPLFPDETIKGELEIISKTPSKSKPSIGSMIIDSKVFNSNN